MFVPITPCRLTDTRPSPYTVGARTTPIGAAEAATFQVTGAVGSCTVPSDATAVAMTVTVVGPTANGFLTVYPADAARPPTASVNFLAGEVRQNTVQAKLSATGSIAVYNYAGASDVVLDVTGYYVDHDHDDRYYTKAQIDARTTTRTLSVTAEGLNLFANSVITHSPGGGLAWGNNFNASATWALARPADATGAGDIMLTIWFTRADTLAGDVSFSARPQDLNDADSLGRPVLVVLHDPVDRRAEHPAQRDDHVARRERGPLVLEHRRPARLHHSQRVPEQCVRPRHVAHVPGHTVIPTRRPIACSASRCDRCPIRESDRDGTFDPGGRGVRR